VVLKEGRNREVRRLWEAVGVEISRLVRVRYDQFSLPKWLKPGKSRFLDEEVVVRVYQRLGLEQQGGSDNNRSPKGRGDRGRSDRGRSDKGSSDKGPRNSRRRA